VGERISACPELVVWRQNGARDQYSDQGRPEETHAVLRRRAAAAHQSLQEYLLRKLVQDAARPTLDEVFDLIEGRPAVESTATVDDVVKLIREDRAGH